LDILTKICVVILVVLILLAVPVFINGAIVGPKYKTLYETEQIASKLHQQAARDAELAYQRVFQDLQAAKQRAIDIAADRDEKIRQLSAQLEEERLKGTELGGKLNSISSEIVEINASLKQYIERAKLFSERIAQQQEQIDKLTSENIDLYNQLKTKTADYERVQQIAKGLREQISEYKQTIADLGKQIEALKAGTAGPLRESMAAVPPSLGSEAAISGTITAVDVDNNLASIDIGSANGVQPGMEMIISRGDRLVGYLRIEEVETNEAAGIIIEKQLTPMQGDSVATRARILK